MQLNHSSAIVTICRLEKLFVLLHNQSAIHIWLRTQNTANSTSHWLLLCIEGSQQQQLKKKFDLL